MHPPPTHTLAEGLWVDEGHWVWESQFSLSLTVSLWMAPHPYVGITNWTWGVIKKMCS